MLAALSLTRQNSYQNLSRQFGGLSRVLKQTSDDFMSSEVNSAVKHSFEESNEEEFIQR